MALEQPDASHALPANDVRIALFSDSLSTSLNHHPMKLKSTESLDGFQLVGLDTSPTPKTSIADTAAGSAAKHLKTDTNYHVCEPTPAYQSVMRWMSEHIYDPKSLGDLNAIMNDKSCPGDLVSKANRALAVTGDKYDKVLSAEETKALNDSTAGHFGGVGVLIVNLPTAASKKNSTSDSAATKDAPTEPTILRTIDGTPAASANLHPGDVIVRVDGRDTSHMNIDNVELLLRGDIGTSVEVVVNRHGDLIDQKFTRANIETPSVEKPKDLGNGITYIRVENFSNSNTANDLKKALQANPQSKAFVIDLRDNPGGYVDQSLHAAELFIQEGVLLHERSRESSAPSDPAYSDVTYRADSHGQVITTVYAKTTVTDVEPRMPDVVGERPVVLLVNRGSASAAEIFTGALHDTGKATTIGETTYGKGIAQLLLQGGPEGTTDKVTNSHYTTPSGVWPGDAANNRVGLQPDIKVAQPANIEYGSPQDDQLNAAVANLLERTK